VTTHDQALASAPSLDVIVSVDVEEHYRIEAAKGLLLAPHEEEYYRRRVVCVTQWLLDRLAQHNIRATFFIVGDLARREPRLVRTIAAQGHEIACHGWDHRRLSELGCAAFREQLRRSRQVLEELSGAQVAGFRAPTFSLGRTTPWAPQLLLEEGFRYDSSIYPIRHDRYGDPTLPLSAFYLETEAGRLLELPPLVWTWRGRRIPAAGGGYFRLFPGALLSLALRQQARLRPHTPAMLYFHPWEFDPHQKKLPLARLRAWRTYFGITRTRPRWQKLLRLLSGNADSHTPPWRCLRAIDAAEKILASGKDLPHICLTGAGV